jgi:hypothetical protein
VIILTLRTRILCCLAICAFVVLVGCKPNPPRVTETASPKPTAETATPTTTPEPATAPAQPPATASETSAARPSGPIEFTDVTAKAGIRFKHNTGAFGKKYLPETMGSGACFLDYDNDGWQDILLINSTDWPGHEPGKSFSALYHNNQDGTFTDVTRQAGLAVEMYGLGCAV